MDEQQEQMKDGDVLPVASRLSVRKLWRILSRYFPLYKPYWPELIVVFILLPLAGSVIVTVVPLCMKMVLDVAFPRKDLNLLLILASIVLVTLIMDRTLMVLIRNAIFGHLRIRTMAMLGSRFYQNILRLSMRYHHQTPVGEKIFRCDTDILDVSEMMGTFLPSVVQSFWQFLFIIGTMCLIDWRPVVIAGACSPVFFLIGQILFNQYRRVDLAQRLRGQEMTSHLERTLSAPAVVYSHGMRRRESVGYQRRLVTYSIANMIYWFMNELAIVLVWPSELPQFMIVFIIGLCGWWVITGELTIGEWQAMSMLIVQAIVPLGILISYYQQLRLRMIPAERILNLLDATDRILDAPDAVELPDLIGRIEFRDVHFAYSPDKPVLRGLSFTIEPGQRVAFVGPSGIGKSTILNLILRFYDPDQGQVLIDGVDLRRITLAPYRRQIGIVLQEPVIFDGTLRENILYGALDGAGPKEIDRAAATAGLEDFIQGLAQGYDTPLQGGNLALGQKQRISLARCLAGRPSVVLLDEPTSLVDPASKQEIVDAIDRVVGGRTAVFVSHDLLTLRNLDKIIVLNHGVVAEEGTHEALLERKGLYHDLWRMQVERSLREQATAAGD